MSMRYSHRLQILLDDERHERISSAAHKRGVSVATVVREAIDRGIASPEVPRRAAGLRILEAPDMEVPDPADLLDELDAVRGRHQ